MIWDCGYLKIKEMLVICLCAFLFALPDDARYEEPYIMITMDGVALDGFCHLHFLLSGEGNVGIEIRNNLRRTDWRKRRSTRAESLGLRTQLTKLCLKPIDICSE